MVSLTLDYATQTYGRVKGASPLLDSALSTAERSVQYAHGQVAPVLEKPIEMVDSLACTGLDKIEQLAPAIKKTPTELLDDTVQLYNSTVGQRYEGLKNYSTEKVTALLGGGGQLVVDTTESYLDYLFPEPQQEEGQDKEAKGLRERVEQLPAKVGRRVYASLLARSQDSLAKLHQTFLVMQYAKDNLGAATRQQLGTTAAWVLREVPGLEGGRLVALGRTLASQLAQTFQAALGLSFLPAELRTRLTTARSHAADLLAHFNQVQVVGELTSTILAQISQKLGYLETSLKQLPPSSSSTSPSTTSSNSTPTTPSPTPVEEEEPAPEQQNNTSS